MQGHWTLSLKEFFRKINVMKIGLLLPSIFSSSRHLEGRIFAPLTPAIGLANGLVNKGHDVLFYTSKDVKTKAKIVPGNNNLTDKNLQYYQFRFRSNEEKEYSTKEIVKRDFEYDLTLKAYKDAKEGRVDIIHSYHDFGAHYFNELTGFPTVYTLHDPLPQQKDTIEYYRLSKFKHHNFVSISNFQREGIVSLNFLATIYHGLRIEDYEFGNNPSNHLIYFGRVLEDKGTDAAIEVALEMGVPISIATSEVRANRNQEFYDTKIAPFIDGKKVKLIGYLAGAEKSDFIKNAKAFLFPLRWPEPFGLTMIESMACGTPVVAYNNGSVSEIVRDGVTGFIIEPEDSGVESKWSIKKKGKGGLMEAIKRIGEIDRRNCRKHVEENFTTEKMVEGYERVYGEVLGS